jgi:hypothetical protein
VRHSAIVRPDDRSILAICVRSASSTDGIACSPTIRPIHRRARAEDVAVSPLRYVALGDSYTIGTGVAEGERWPNQRGGVDPA